VKAYTDYPITELGDAPGLLAPVRACQVLAYDGDKLVTIDVAGVRCQVKAGYVSQLEGRFGEVPPLSRRMLDGLPLVKDDPND
jgi:hypothetical protein